jgi:hypothetical protein
MNLLQGLLQEELENSQNRLHAYREGLAALPQGALYRRFIRGRPYWYIERRNHGKVVNQYVGVDVPKSEIDKFEKAKQERVKYRKAMALLRRQVAVLERAVDSLARKERKNREK